MVCRSRGAGEASLASVAVGIGGLFLIEAKPAIIATTYQTRWGLFNDSANPALMHRRQ